MKGKTLLLLLEFALLGWVGSSDATAEEISFGPSIRVSDSTERPRVAPSIAVDTCGNINVVWEDCRDGFDTEDIYFSRSTNEGSTWSTSVKVNDEFPGNCINPSLDVDNSGNLYVAWEQEGDGNIYFSMSADSGKTWTPDVRVNEDVPGYKGHPSLAVDGDGNIYVTWSDDRNGPADIYFAKSTDGGSTWTTPNVKVNSPSSGYQLLSHTAVGDSGWVYAVWCDNRVGVWDGFFSLSEDSGGTWSPDVRVNDDDHRHVADPRVAVGKGGVIYVVWEVGGIYFARSRDNGQSWTNPNIKVNSDSLSLSDYSQPWIRVDDQGRISVVWRGRSGPEDDYKTHIYCAMSRDSGTTWTDPEIRVDDSLCIWGELPSLDIGPYGNLYIAWDGSRITVHPVEIFFALRKPTNTIVTEPLPNVIPKTFKLFQNYPNPFNSTTAISYQLSEVRPHRATLRIYNILGEEVITLVDEKQKVGSYQTTWNGRDRNRKDVSSGVYLCRLRASGYVQTKKLVLLR